MSYGAVADDGKKMQPDAKDGDTEVTPLVQGKAPEMASPVPDRSFWSKLLFGWFTPLLHVGNAKNKLDQEDLDLVQFPNDCQTDQVCSLFEKYWEEECKRNPANPSLVWVLFRAFGPEYLRAGFLKLCNDLCAFVGPQVLHAMIVFLRDPDAPPSRGLGLTLAVTLSQLTMSLCLRHYFFKCYATGLRVRTAIVTAVYKKALVLSSGERQTRTLGEITNLMSVDSQRLQDIPNYLHAVWYSPLQIVLSIFFLWRELGASSLGGVMVIMITIPFTKYIAQFMGKMQKNLMGAKDKRVDLNTEVLSNMKVIKFQAWEEAFLERITELRNTELSRLFQYLVGFTVSRMIWNFTPLLVAMATFAAYVWSGHDLDVATALTSLALFAILRFPLFMLPQVINSAVEGMVAINRVQSFLLADEHTPVGPGGLRENGIQMDGISAAYDSKKPKVKDSSLETKELNDKNWELALMKSQLDDAERQIRELTGSVSDSAMAESGHSTVEDSEQSLLCLRRVNFECKPGELVAVVGGVGCGKSTLINSILGEVRMLSGETSVKGSLAYFSQTPFILNATIRDNILFGHVDEAVDEELYQRALKCCSLSHDLQLFPDGDQTEIGEKGINLSGGQKARIALARAVYHQADLTLVDDALAAVDAHVAKELFDETIAGELLKSNDGERKRSVVLVTNALQHLRHPRVDKIVVVSRGKVVEVGTYTELANNRGSLFAHFLTIIDDTGVNSAACEDLSADELAKEGEAAETRRKSERISRPSTKVEKIEDKPAAKLMTEEARSVGHVSWKVYATWVRAAGVLAPIAIVLGFTITESTTVVSTWWLTYWSEHGAEHSQNYFLGIYAIINLSAGVLSFFRMLMVALIGLRASRKLFAEMLAVVLHAPMSFYDTTPVGRIVNRFSKDIYTTDEKLMPDLSTYLSTLFSVFSTIAVISGVTPVFVLCLVPMILFYVNEQRFFTITYRELKRLDSVNRSPIYALLGESVDGVSVIRSFSAQGSLLDRLSKMLNMQQHAYFLTCSAQSWLAVRLELIGTLIITFACLSAVMEHWFFGADENFAGLAGLAISYSLQVTQALNWSVRMASDLEADMVAVERIDEYTHLENEAPRRRAVDDNIEESWPSEGGITFNDAKMRYRPGLPLVLKGLTLKIPGGSKVGVVGRTGAGKSTLMVALMRIVELSEGSIEIDGQDINEVGLATLRRTMAVIPQDPVLFSGSIRSNLDPFNEYSDHVLFETLERVGLYASKMSSNSLTDLGIACVQTLDDEVAEGGMNFSVGQRQLLVIGRALLRGAKIVVMDEATAAVDAQTDAAIQKTIRTEFKDATCLTVAHRINTIMDSDYVLVMSDGKAAEFDSPSSLMKQAGLFRDLVKASAQE